MNPDPQPSSPGHREIALQPLDPQALRPLQEALAPFGVTVAEAARRSGEVRLRLARPDGGSTWAVILPRRPGARAFVRTRRFDLGYTQEDAAAVPGGDEAEDQGDPTTFAQLRALGRALERPEVAALVANELVDASARPAGTGMRALREIGAGHGDLGTVDEGALTDFDVSRCTRGASVPPRRLGPDHLVLAAGGELRIHRVEGELVPGDALHYRKCILGRASLGQAGGWSKLILAERCRECGARHACAGVFERTSGAEGPAFSGPFAPPPSEPVAASPAPATASTQPDTAAPPAAQGKADTQSVPAERPSDPGAIARLRALSAQSGALATLGSAAFRAWVAAVSQGVASGDGAPLLVVEGAHLTGRDGRAALARQIARLGPGTRLLVLGRSPEVLVGGGDPGRAPSEDPLHVAPAESARVARSLRGTVLALTDYRLPGRHDVDPWWLLCDLRPAHAPAPQPIDLLMVANRKCVTVCRYCNLPLRMRRSTALRDAWANIEEAAVLGAREMQFFGGEVTLRPELYTLVRYGTRLGLACDLATTGVGLDDAAVTALAQCGVRDLSVSIDAPIAEVHDDLKNREGMFDIAVAASRLFKERGARWVGLNTVVTPLNYHLLDGVVELAASLGLDNVTFFFCQPIAEIGNESPLLNEAQVRELLERVLPACRRLAEETGVRVSVRPGIDREPGRPDEIAARVASGVYSRLYRRDESCRHTDTMVAIDPEGDVRLCTQPWPQFLPEMVVGNLREHSLATILASERAAAFRKIAGQLDVCRYCTLDHVVGDEVGGCLVGTGGVER